MLLKLLLLAAIIYGVYYFFIKQKPLPNQSNKKDEDVLVECDKCGTYVSTKDAIIKNGKYYCSKECAKG